jgi:hypothetical protein
MDTSEQPQDAFVADLIVDDEEIILMFGVGDHTCVRWRINEDQLKNIVVKGVTRLLE